MADDFSDEEPDSPGSTPRGGKKRANHNELERKRRQHQKDRLNDLKDVVPSLKQERPSTVLILTKSKEYIEMLENRTTQYEAELVTLRERAGVPAKAPRPLTASTGAAVVDEIDALRQENIDLQAKMEQLEKRLNQTTKARAPAPAAAAMAPPMHYEPRAYTAAQMLISAAAEAGTEPHSPQNFRKRKSYADNDFEAAKLDYHRRRNSTVESMRDHAQRIKDEGVNLFQNFIRESRRASLPSASLHPEEFNQHDMMHHH